MFRNHKPTDIVPSLEGLPAAVAAINGPGDILAVNTGTVDHSESLIELAQQSRGDGRVSIIDPGEHQWEVRVSSLDTMAADLRALQDEVDTPEGSLIAVVPSLSEVFNHDGRRRERFAALGGGMTVRLCDGQTVVQATAGQVADFTALIPNRLAKLNDASPDTQALSELIERDRRGEWFEQGVFLGENSVVEQIQRHGRPLAEYCAKFGNIAMIFAVYGPGYWVGMPADIKKSPSKETAARYQAHVQSAPQLVIFDSGSEAYKDTKQLGLKDAWMPHGQIQYDVDMLGIDSTVVSRARNKISFDPGQSHDAFASLGFDEYWEWDGLANQIVEV